MEKLELSYCLFKRNVPYEVQDNGKIKLLFNLIKDNHSLPTMEMPCGKCIYCQKRYSAQWALRCVLESKSYFENCFITLTYNNENLKDINLIKRDYQLFIKRLRKKIQPKKIRYFLAGEYGGKGYRPHFHALIFGWVPSDLKFFKKDGKVDLFLSDELSELWGQGFVSVGIDMSTQAIKYCAKYLNKLQTLPKQITQKPFVAMSNGIGKDQFTAQMLLENGVWLNGIKYSIPRYFLKLADKKGLVHELEIQKKLQVKKFELLQVDLNSNDHLQLLRNYFAWCYRNNVSYQHLYDLKDYDKWQLFKGIKRDLDELDKKLYD